MIKHLCEKHEGLLPSDSIKSSEVMGFVNKFFDYLQSIGVITYSLESTTAPKKWTKIPEKITEDKLKKLGKDPEFKEMVKEKLRDR